MSMREDISTVLLDEETIAKRTHELAAAISRDYRILFPVVVCVLKGAVVFFTDLTRQMDIYMEMDFIAASSYGSGRRSSGEVLIKQDLSVDITDRHVLLVEDIVDTGCTLSALIERLKDRKPASIKCVALCNKELRRTVDFHADYVGFEVEDKFLVGIGLDYNGRYRNLPFVGVLKPSVYSSSSDGDE
jgi:hypoxanthine phosphoribosyltransferase